MGKCFQNVSFQIWVMIRQIWMKVGGHPSWRMKKLMLLHKKRRRQRATSSGLVTVDWKRVQGLYENDEVVSLQVYGYNRGGVLVQGEGIQGFVPVSHLVDMPCNAAEDERRQVLNDYVGRTLDLKVIECEPSQERIVLSERAALAGQGRRRQLFNTLKPGEIVHGTVTNVTDFGVFRRPGWSGRTDPCV